MKSQLIFIFISVLILAGCSKKITPVQEPESLQPEWLSKKPMTEFYYVGVGYASKTADNNFIKVAKRSALDDLISEIKVHVSSSSVLQQIDDDESFKEQYESIIQTTAAEEIEEYELVDTWEDGGSYWVYYRLSKSRYKEIKAEKKRKALLLATEFYEKGLAFENQQDIIKAGGAYATGLLSLRKYLADADIVRFNNENLVIGAELYSSIQRVLNKVKIESTEHEVVFEKRSDRNKKIEVKVSLADSGTPIAGFPIFGSFTVGNGALHQNYTSNDDGSFYVIVNKLGTGKRQRIKLQPNVMQLSNLEEEDELVQLLIERLKLPSEQIEFTVKQPTIYFTSKERILGYEKRTPEVSNRLKTLLTENGFVLTNEKSNADLVLDLQADTEEGGEKGNIYIAYLNLSISVFDNEAQKQIYGVSLDRIKGYSLSFERASREGYNEALKRIETDTIDEIIKAIL